MQAGVGQAGAEVTIDAGAFGGIVRGGEAMSGQAGRQGGDAGVQVDMSMCGQPGLDGLEDGRVDAGHGGQGAERGAARVDGELSIIDEQRVQAIRAEVRPALGGRRQEGDRARGPVGWRVLLALSRQQRGGRGGRPGLGRVVGFMPGHGQGQEVLGEPVRVQRLQDCGPAAVSRRIAGGVVAEDLRGIAQLKVFQECRADARGDAAGERGGEHDLVHDVGRGAVRTPRCPGPRCAVTVQAGPVQLLAVQEVHGEASHVRWRALARHVRVDRGQRGHVHRQGQPELRVA